MVEIDNESLYNSSASLKTKKKVPNNRKHINIWETYPSYKDISKTRERLKHTFLLILGFGYVYALFIITSNIIFSLGLSGVIIIIVIMLIHDQFFFFSHFFSKGNFQPFGKFIFWKTIEDPFTIFYTHRKDNFTVALRTFKITVIPQNIHANMRQFIQSLNSLLIPFSFQVIQKPLLNEDKFSFKTILIFNLYYSIYGKITYSKLQELLLKLKSYTSALDSGLAANFHHFKISKLTSLEIIDSIRASFIPQNMLDKTLSENVLIKKSQTYFLIGKILLMISIIFLLDLLFFTSSIPIFVRIGVTVGVSILITKLFARELLFHLFTSKFFAMKDIETINPFSNIDFYYSSQTPDTIFFHIEGNITGGIKMVNVKYIIPPPFFFSSKFYLGLIKEKIPFTSSFITAPMSYYEFEKEGYEYLQEKEKKIHLKMIKTEADENNWLSQRSGVWKTIITFSTSCVQFSTKLEMNQLIDIELALQTQIQNLIINFKGNFNNFILEPLRSTHLISGFQVEVLKNKSIRFVGSHLNYILMQGRTLTKLIDIVDEFKKGMDTRIAAEFNSPLQLESSVTIGNTINTEFLKEEIPAGFNLQQLHSLLIMNGTIQSREHTAMKLILGLIQDSFPVLIFDFYGEWTGIINYFQKTEYAKNFLYFKLGKTLNLHPLSSEILYDKDNIKYLDYMIDAYGLCFKKDEKTMEMFRNTIIRNADTALSTLKLDLTTKREWEKNPVTDELIGFLQGFSEQDLIFFRPIKNEQEEIIKPYEFITSDKSIIIDLSQSPDLVKKCFFMMVILSKCIHYLNTEGEYVSKFLYIPHIDMIFDNFHLDKHIKYGKIDKFFQPLTRRDFGLICSCAQNHYLHPNLFNSYFNNYISFKTIDNRDIAQLKNILNLEEIHGQGIYSKTRNESYQIKYLMSMQPEEALIKRSDLHQPFPVKIDISEVNLLPKMEWEDIIKYMRTQGYDLEHTERAILQQRKKTILEKDFGDYVVLIDPIIKFLRNIAIVDKIGNLYLTKIKEELKKSLHPVLSTITNDKQRIKEMRSKILEILLTQEYLVENHPKRASGSESIRTSYSVGIHFQKALDDYFNTQREIQTLPEIEVVESDSYSKDILANLPFNEEEQAQLTEALAKEIADSLYWELFMLHKHLARNNTKKVAEIATNFVKRFFHRLFHRYYNVNYAVVDRDIENFISFITRIDRFPFTKKELNVYLKKYMRVSENETKEFYATLYQELSSFFKRLQNFINQA
ncbi:MAG: hypothetical protein ACFFA8_03965 [Promethearchaeota archaeon]